MTPAHVLAALALLTAAVSWPQPPPVLPLPSRSGPEGPPRPFGVEPAPETSPAPTARGLAGAQNRVLLFGPFPRGGLARGVSEGALPLSGQAQVRDLAFARIASTGADTVRIPVDWRSLAPVSPPVGFDARDPSSPLYNFAALDSAVTGAVAAGLQPLLVVSHAPAYAEAPNRWPYAYPGSWDPSPVAFEQFAAALARRYDGSFPDPAAPARPLPRVRLFQAWNEPNLARYLEPQWVVSGRRWRAFSPLLYRQLLNAFYAGVKSVQPDDLVVTAGVAPNGDPPGAGRMAPVRFLSELLCLPASPAPRRAAAERGTARRGTARRLLPHARRAVASSCPDPSHFDVLAFHPLSVGDPDLPAASSQDVSIADASKITGLLRQAERLRTALPAGVKPVWVTELNFESAPASPQGVPGALQAQWISRALHRLWVAGIGLVDWQFLVDPYPGLRAATSTGGTFEYQRPAGLYSAGPGGDLAGARPKPFLRGFTFPFDPLRVTRVRVRVWALLMRPGQPVMLQRQDRARAWRTIARLHADRYGVLNALVMLRGAVSLRLQSGGLVSAVVRVPARRSRL